MNLTPRLSEGYRVCDVHSCECQPQHLKLMKINSGTRSVCDVSFVRVSAPTHPVSRRLDNRGVIDDSFIQFVQVCGSEVGFSVGGVISYLRIFLRKVGREIPNVRAASVRFHPTSFNACSICSFVSVLETDDPDT